VKAAPVVPESAPVAVKAEVPAKEKITVTQEEYVCFGTIAPDNPECQMCQFNKECAEKAASK
jgi:hypothetical protein